LERKKLSGTEKRKRKRSNGKVSPPEHVVVAHSSKRKRAYRHEKGGKTQDLHGLLPRELSPRPLRKKKGRVGGDGRETPSISSSFLAEKGVEVPVGVVDGKNARKNSPSLSLLKKRIGVGAIS